MFRTLVCVMATVPLMLAAISHARPDATAVFDAVGVADRLIDQNDRLTTIDMSFSITRTVYFDEKGLDKAATEFEAQLAKVSDRVAREALRQQLRQDYLATQAADMEQVHARYFKGIVTASGMYEVVEFDRKASEPGAKQIATFTSDGERYGFVDPINRQQQIAGRDQRSTTATMTGALLIHAQSWMRRVNPIASTDKVELAPSDPQHTILLQGPTDYTLNAFASRYEMSEGSTIASRSVRSIPDGATVAEFENDRLKALAGGVLRPLRRAEIKYRPVEQGTERDEKYEVEVYEVSRVNFPVEAAQFRPKRDERLPTILEWKEGDADPVETPGKTVPPNPPKMNDESFSNILAVSNTEPASSDSFLRRNAWLVLAPAALVLGTVVLILRLRLGTRL